jgi:hypothetical protein
MTVLSFPLIFFKELSFICHDGEMEFDTQKLALLFRDPSLCSNHTFLLQVQNSKYFCITREDINPKLATTQLKKLCNIHDFAYVELDNYFVVTHLKWV